jgi:hypothetical protein
MNSLDFKFLASITGLASGTEFNPQINSNLRGTFNCLLNSTSDQDSGGFAE